MANDCIPFFEPGQNVTGKATAAVTGKRFVQITDTRAGGPGISDSADQSNLYSVGLPDASGAAGAGKWCIGVAGYDAPEDADVKIIRGGIVPVESGEAGDAGDPITTDATGKAVQADTVGDVILGYLAADCGATGDAEVILIS